VDGQRKRRKVVAATQAEALAKYKELQKRMAEGGSVSADKLTVAVWLEEWLEKEARPSVRPRTFATYAAMVRQHLVPALGKYQLPKLAPSAVRDYMLARRKAGLSPRTIQQHHAVLRRALRVAQGYGYVARNAAQLVSPPAVKRKEVAPMSTEQCNTFLKALEGDRLAPLYKVAMATGLRQSELLGLRWVDVDLDEGTLQVTVTLQRYDGAFHLDDPKTERSRRTLALAAPVVDALKEQQALQRKEQKACMRAGWPWEGAAWGLVFATETGGPLLSTKVTRTFQKALQDAKLPRFRFHDLRHGAATYLLSAGVELIVVQRILGHSTIHTTANVYAHVLPELQRDAAERIGAVLFGS
jgi:integrase